MWVRRWAVLLDAAGWGLQAVPSFESPQISKFQKGRRAMLGLALGLVIGAMIQAPGASGRPNQSVTPEAQAKATQPGMIPGPPPPEPETVSVAASRAAAGNQLAVGTPICAVLMKTVDAKRAKAGDKVVARATLAVLSHGRVLIADGARITGHVVRVKARSSADPQSEVALVFDRVALKGGGELRLPLTVQAIGFNALSMKTDDETASVDPYGPPPMLDAASNVQIRHSSIPRPQAQAPTHGPTTGGRDSDQMGASTFALDVGSKGVVGLPGLALTEGTDATEGSEVSSRTKNVKLEGGSQLVLRVIKGEGQS